MGRVLLETTSFRGRRIMTTDADLIRKIGAAAFSDALDIDLCLAVLQESGEHPVIQAINATKATRAAVIIQRALMQRILMTVERAFAPCFPKRTDYHARVAFELLARPHVF